MIILRCMSVLLPAMIALVSLPAFAANRKLAWDPNSESNLAGYKVYLGLQEVMWVV